MQEVQAFQESRDAWGEGKMISEQKLIEAGYHKCEGSENTYMKDLSKGDVHAVFAKNFEPEVTQFCLFFYHGCYKFEISTDDIVNPNNLEYLEKHFEELYKKIIKE